MDQRQINTALADFLQLGVRASIDRPKHAAIFTQPNCPWCDKAADAFTAAGYEVSTFDITTLPDAVKAAFAERFQTVPQAVVRGLLVGGFEKVQAYLAAASHLDYVKQTAQG